VHRVLTHLADNEDAIPSYPLIVVDEYQDFSLLETSFLRLLAEKSKVLVAGDDDQALYAFKNAFGLEHDRNGHSARRGGDECLGDRGNLVHREAHNDQPLLCRIDKLEERLVCPPHRDRLGRRPGPDDADATPPGRLLPLRGAFERERKRRRVD
jgi:hypothetical protein